MLYKVSLPARYAMTNKEMMRNKIAHLEQLLMEAGFAHKQMERNLDEMQSKINKYKITNDPKHLVQNNDLIIDLIKMRLELGAKKYHQNVPIRPIDDINRDNFYEAVEEALDLCVYLSAFMIRLMEEREQGESEATTETDQKNEANDDGETENSKK